MDNLIVSREQAQQQFPEYAVYYTDATVVLIARSNTRAQLVDFTGHDVSSIVCIVPDGVHVELLFDFTSALTHITLTVAAYRGAQVSCQFLVSATWLSRFSLRALPCAHDATIRVVGRYYASAQQTLTLDIQQLHTHAHGATTVCLKGLVADQADVCVHGGIMIGADALNTSAQLSSKALLLSGSARVTGRPELEIKNAQVACKHGHAVGPLSEEQLLYAQARGCTAQDAGRMLLDAFMAEDLDEQLLLSYRQAYANRYT